MVAIDANLCNVSGVDKMGDRWRQRIRIVLKCGKCKNSRIYRVVIAHIDATGNSFLVKQAVVQSVKQPYLTDYERKIVEDHDKQIIKEALNTSDEPVSPSKETL